MSAPPKIWVKHSPEERLSVVVDKFLPASLVRPFYCISVPDADHGARSDRQRSRDRERGVRDGQLDWDVMQAPGLARKLELKRGKNDLTAAQRQTFGDLQACGLPPIKARTLREVYEGLRAQGFRFLANVETTLAIWEANLSAMDREAEGIKAGTIVKKKPNPRKADPRYTAGKMVVRRARKAGVGL